MLRGINRIIPAQDVQMGDISLKQPLPVGNYQQVDPFLLLHHVGPLKQTPGDKSIMDIGGHPHRGFEPVTFVFKGAVHHKDSRGNDSIVKAGGVQWMTAGMGIVHSESAPKEFVEQGGDLELIQLWVNLPSKYKMNQPRYQGVQMEEIPSKILEDGASSVNIISGQHEGLRGPIESLTGIKAFTLNLKSGARYSFIEPSDRNAILYQLEGTTTINGITGGPHKLTVFKQDNDKIELEANTDSTLLYVSGDPIDEKVTQYGPFVMNTQTEVLEAMRDYQMGKMGILI